MNQETKQKFLPLLIWDFFGPSATPTAEHFQKHLFDFLKRNEISNATVELKSEGDMHMGVRCTVVEIDLALKVAAILKPGKRSLLPSLNQHSVN